MKKIVENAVFREDYKYLEEISEQFIEFLKENIDVTYNNKTKKLKLIPCELRLDQKTIQIKFIYDRNLHTNSKFLINAIKAKYDSFNVYDVMFVSYSYLSNKKKMFKDFFQSNDDIKALESLKPYYDYIQFEIKKEECIIAIMKKYLKAECEGKTKKDLMNLIMIQTKIVEDCSIIFDEMIEQVFIRNAKFPHPIYKCINPAFTVSFKLASKSIFLTSLDQSQKVNVGAVKQEMITKFKEIFSGACTLKISYMFPKENENECKAAICEISGNTKEMSTVYSDELNTDCDFSCIKLEENDVPECISKLYVIINFSYYFNSADKKANFEQKLMIEGAKLLQSNKCTINEWKIIESFIKYPENVKEEYYGKFCEFLNEKKKEIMKAYLFLHFEPSDEQIAIRGLESKINNFTKKNKKRKYDQFQLYRIANDFNQNQISVKLIEITPEFMDLIQSFPSVLYNHALMRNIKKISLTKALKLEKNDYEKQNKFTQEIVNGIICLFITFCSEVSWNKIDIIHFIERIFTFNKTIVEGFHSINEGIENDEKYIWIIEKEDDKCEILLNKKIIYEIEYKLMQKKYPCIIIDNQKNWTKEKKNNLKISELNYLVVETFNICFFDQEGEYEEIKVIDWDITFDKESMTKNFLNNNGDIMAKVYDHANKSEAILRRLESFEELKNYRIISSEDKDSMEKGNCVCRREPCICHLKFPRPIIPTNLLEEYQYFVDNCEEGGKDIIYNFKFQNERESVIESLRTYAFKFSNNEEDIKLKITAADENMNEITETISNLLEKAKQKQGKLGITINRKEEKEIIYDKCVADIVKVWLKDKDQIDDFMELSFRVINQSFEFNSAWTSVVIGMIEFCTLIATKKYDEENEDHIFFDRIWISHFKQAFNKSKQKIRVKSNEIAEGSDHDQIAIKQEMIKYIYACHLKTIETIPVLHSIEDFYKAYIFDVKTNSAFKTLLSRFEKSDLKLIKNFPITLVAKGINQFCENRNYYDDNNKLKLKKETKAIIFKEFDCKPNVKMFKKYEKKAKKFCKAEVYSYILYTAPKYEMVTLKELNNREFKQAVVVVADVCYFESEEIVPYLHPRMLLILKSNLSKKLKEEKKKKKKNKNKNSSDEESEEEIITKKQKLAQRKRNRQNTSESDHESDSKSESKNDSDSESSDEGLKKKKVKKESSNYESDSDSDSDTKRKKKFDRDSEDSDSDVKKKKISDSESD